MASLKFPELKQNSDFRLLTVFPSDDDENPVTCTLVVYSLEHPPPYHALSYVWGDSTVTVNIIINATPFKATANLEIALRAIRKRLGDPKDPLISTLAELAASQPSESARTCDGAYRIWVDALCINQQDFPERNAQVLRMRDIYSRSASTIAWIGQPADSSETAFLLISVLAAGEQHPRYAEVIELEGNKYVCLWRAVARLLEREYWCRCWILQEIALAKHVFFLCGSDYTDLDTMTFALYGMQFRHEHILEVLGYPDCDRKMQKDFMLKIIMKLNLKKWAAEAREKHKSHSQLPGPQEDLTGEEKEEYDKEKARLDHLLLYEPSTPLQYVTVEKTRARLQSSVLHDQIYSLLGLCDDAQEMIPAPSYQTPFHQVAQDFYMRLAEKTQSIDWIRFPSGNEPLNAPFLESKLPDALSKDDQLASKSEGRRKGYSVHYEQITGERAKGLWPSWLPDNCKSYGDGAHGNSMVEGCLYRGTKDQVVEFRFNGAVLSCRGLIFDTIADPEFHSGNSSQIATSVASAKNPYGDAAKTFEAIWQSATQYRGMERATANQAKDCAWAFSEYWNHKWAGSASEAIENLHSRPQILTGVMQDMTIEDETTHPTWPHEVLYRPMSTFDAESIDPMKTVRRWGLLEDQADLMIHGYSLREWVHLRTCMQSISSDDPVNKPGIVEHMHNDDMEGLNEPLLTNIVNLLNLNLDITDMLPSIMRALHSVKCMPSSNELFTTEKGYIGGRFKCCSQKQGDVIALLSGCNCPVMLRPRDGGGYTYIGEAYVHGIMYGEACTSETGDQVEWIDIH